MEANSLTSDEIQILEAGFQTEFWAVFKKWMELGQKSTTAMIEQASINSVDDCVKLSKHLAIKKTRAELIALPEMVRATIEMQKKIAAKKTAANGHAGLSAA